MAEVICVGVAYLDYVFEADPPAAHDVTTFAHEYRQFGGGMAATASVAVSLLGGYSVLWSRLGDDEAGDRILDGLSHRGVQIDGIRRIRGAQSPVSSIVTGDDGIHQAVMFPGRNLDNDAGWLPLERIFDTSAVLVDPRWPDAAMAVLERARANRIPGVLEADIGPQPVARELVELASHVVFSLPGLAQFTDTTDIEAGLRKAHEATDAALGVTAGASGFYWLDPESGETQRIPAMDIKAIDTLGAGDVFHGAFALAVAEGKDIETAGRFANIAAGLKCARPGGRDAIPSRAEVWGVMEGATRASPPAPAS
ncbi:MAG: sugar kinase [Alphaproteobacteria bacterium]|nr:sugar kinase [Alphaproteobacteria bacterium]